MVDVCKKRENYLTWDEYFMAIAKLSAMRSKDPSTQVGACIVDKNNRILSIGYNGTFYVTTINDTSVAYM